MQKKFSLGISLLILSIVVFTGYNIFDLTSKSSENRYNRLINDLNRDTTDFTSWVGGKGEILNTAKGRSSIRQRISWITSPMGRLPVKRI